jgi:hypothetical protein
MNYSVEIVTVVAKVVAIFTRDSKKKKKKAKNNKNKEKNTDSAEE